MKKEAIVSVRLSHADKDLITSAAQRERRSAASFMLAASVNAAKSSEKSSESVGFLSKTRNK